MKFKELLEKYDWDAIAATFLKIYPDQEKSLKGYQHVCEELRAITPVETSMCIVLEEVFDEYEQKYYTDVSGKNGTLKKEAAPEFFKDDELGNQEESYGLDFTDWAEWLAMEIDPDTLATYSEIDIIGHCLWEMTFYGYSRETIKQTIDEIARSAEEAKNNPDSLLTLVEDEQGNLKTPD